MARSNDFLWVNLDAPEDVALEIRHAANYWRRSLPRPARKRAGRAFRFEDTKLAFMSEYPRTRTGLCFEW
jgi:hypothetical protein